MLKIHVPSASIRVWIFKVREGDRLKYSAYVKTLFCVNDQLNARLYAPLCELR